MKKGLFLALILIALPATINATTVQAKSETASDSVELTVVKPSKLTKESKEERKAREKRERQAIDSIAHIKAVEAIDSGYFVILADNLSLGRLGYMVSDINSNANFILMQNDGGIFQIAFNNGRLGLNGMGGVTLHGAIRNKQVKNDKNGGVFVSYNLIGSGVNAYVTISLMPGSDRVDATVTQMMGPERISMMGSLVPYRNDDITIEK